MLADTSNARFNSKACRQSMYDSLESFSFKASHLPLLPAGEVRRFIRDAAAVEFGNIKLINIRMPITLIGKVC